LKSRLEIDRPRAPSNTPAPDHDGIDFDYLGLLVFDMPLKGLQQRSIETRSRIVAVAAETFMNQSYAAVSTHEIASAAGVTQGLVTYHFKSKRGLWQAAMDFQFGRFRNTLHGQIQELREFDERTFIRETIRQLVGLEMQYPSIVRFMIGSGTSAEPDLDWLLERHIRPVYDAICHIFEVGRRHGVLRQVPIANAYYVLVTAGSVFSLVDEMRVIAGQDATSPAFASAHAQCLVTMLMSDD
jgi:AcrR family transcriptional regulator